MESRARNLGRLIEHTRRERGRTRLDLVAALGDRNTMKGLRRLQRLESGGIAPREFLDRVLSVLAIDGTVVRDAMARDASDRERWLDEDVQLRLVVKPMPGLYLDVPLPPTAADDTVAAMEHARQVAREKGMLVSLVCSRRRSVWFGADGNLLGETESGPVMRLRGKVPVSFQETTVEDDLSEVTSSSPFH